MSTEWGRAEASDLKAAGAEPLPHARNGLVLKGWCVESRKRPILNSLAIREWEEKLGTSHMPEMVFGESSLSLLHISSGIKLHFNALDALRGWKQESLPPVEVPAAAKWKFRSKPSEQVILDYDYTFTTPYCGSEMIEPNYEKKGLHWQDTDERIDLAALSSREPILFYDELRVDGVLMRLRDTRVYCAFGSNGNAEPVVLRESCWREATIQSLSAQGIPSDSAAYGDPNLIVHKLPIIMQKNQRLEISR
ncbi:TIP41-like protein [Ananas comosus]|uniref:TIP41-like protein n=1 Tax=Ananas comosus TaxID=4615 RepID=A0A199W560_ANACO|nr:TIP41-like protein [Ananas comosus]